MLGSDESELLVMLNCDSSCSGWVLTSNSDRVEPVSMLKLSGSGSSLDDVAGGMHSDRSVSYTIAKLHF